MEERYLKIAEFCEKEGYSKSYVQKLATKRLLPLKTFMGKPVKPFQIDMDAYRSMVSTTSVDRSLKTEEHEKSVELRPIPKRKESLWQQSN